MTNLLDNRKDSFLNAIIVHPFIKEQSTSSYDLQARLDEAKGLARAINLNVAFSEILTIRSIRPATLLGTGQIESLKSIVSTTSSPLVIIDTALTPIQQRNLEKTLQCKVIDRTALILEIFGARARTAEGRLQVELAALTYQKSRLVRSWTHLERQRGGLGFIGGPGETQLEIDRRLINQRILKIQKELETVKRTRLLHRQARKRVPYPIVALVGYTNAGKSTLFNRLTHANVFAEDLLFATLDPTMRFVKLPSGKDIILSDTVGFISQLPTQLIAAFRATLEEVLEADLIIHVRDISHKETLQQKEDVSKILEELGIMEKPQRITEALNKKDLLEVPASSVFQKNSSDMILLSALTGEGLDDLLKHIEKKLNAHHKIYKVNLSSSAGSALAWLYQQGEVLDRHDKEGLIHVKVRLSLENWMRFQKRDKEFNSHHNLPADKE